MPAPRPVEIVTAEPDEYAVYSAILRPRYGDVIVGDSTLDAAPAFCLDGNQLTSECARRDRSKAALEMWTDYSSRNARRLMLVQRFARDVHVTLARDWKATSHPRCAGPTRIQFSRVGFDRTRRFALVTVRTARGAGPYPECGFGSSSTLVYERRKSGAWRVRYFIGGMIT